MSAIIWAGVAGGVWADVVVGGGFGLDIVVTISDLKRFSIQVMSWVQKSNFGLSGTFRPKTTFDFKFSSTIASIGNTKRLLFFSFSFFSFFFWKNNKTLVRNLGDYTDVFDTTPMFLELLLVRKVAGTGHAVRILLG
jgi:hypothetical protein